MRKTARLHTGHNHFNVYVLAFSEEPDDSTYLCVGKNDGELYLGTEGQFGLNRKEGSPNDYKWHFRFMNQGRR